MCDQIYHRFHAFRDKVTCTPVNRCIYTCYSDENFQEIIKCHVEMSMKNDLKFYM